MKQRLRDFSFGILAGMAIALGGILNVICLTYIPAPFRKIVGALCFPIGLILVCFCKLNLFTGKIGYALDNKLNYLIYLLIILLGNYVGATLTGYVAHIFIKEGTDLFTTVNTIAINKMNSVNNIQSAMSTLPYSILCGMLVYLGVYLFKTFKHVILKVIGIIFPIALFVYLGCDHCIANMYYFANGLFFKGYINGFMYLNIFIAIIGNTIGAIILNEFIKRIIKLSQKTKELK